MSNPLKAIGKVFSGVVKVVKKVALPALAIGAAVLTGGAALGLALPSLGGIGASLGLSTAMQGVLATAGQGALGGALGSAVTGGNVLKGATKGFIVGGALGGVNSALSGIGKAASSAAGGTGAAGGAAGQAAAGAASPATGGFASVAASPAASTSGSVLAGAPLTAPASAFSELAAQAASTTAGAFPAAAATGGLGQAAGGFLKFMNANPVVAGNLIQGIGNGIATNEQMKTMREMEAEKQARIRANYSDLSGFSPSRVAAAAPAAAAASRYTYDPRTGAIVAVA